MSRSIFRLKNYRTRWRSHFTAGNGSLGQQRPASIYLSWSNRSLRLSDEGEHRVLPDQ